GGVVRRNDLESGQGEVGHQLAIAIQNEGELAIGASENSVFSPINKKVRPLCSVRESLHSHLGSLGEPSGAEDRSTFGGSGGQAYCEKCRNREIAICAVLLRGGVAVFVELEDLVPGVR